MAAVLLQTGGARFNYAALAFAKSLILRSLEI